MADLQHQDFACHQSDKNTKPVTLASAATIAPTTKFTIVTGTVAIATITPPLSGYHELTLMFTTATPAAFPTTGNIGKAASPVQNQPIVLCYDPNTGKYWPSAL